jgi:hypothetical protein
MFLESLSLWFVLHILSKNENDCISPFYQLPATSVQYTFLPNYTGSLNILLFNFRVFAMFNVDSVKIVLPKFHC